jgi:protein-tyrosine phosphatase
VIDLHCHLLPGVDDGPKTWEEALALGIRLADDGVTLAVTTPHVFLARYPNPEPARIHEGIAHLNRALEGRLRVLPGAEVRVVPELRAWAERVMRAPVDGDRALLLNGTSYVLLEFPPEVIPPGVERLFFELLTAGVRPILAHPERNAALRHRPERLRRFVEQGCGVQVDAPSLLGDHGRQAQRVATQWIEAGWVHVIASDAHDLRARPPKLRRAWEDVARAYGEAVARTLFVENPKAIVEGADLSEVPAR